MNIFEIFGTIAINNSGANKAITDTGSKASKLASNMKDSFEKIGKAAVKYGTIIATGLGAGMAVLLKNTYSEFADYEQLIGGVKKLFGDNWEAVSKYASEAYKKQGMSANEYMELATSFSASLISGLQGDTEKAAQMADMAIQDMADNANTFGTDIEMLKNAYQGFAKGNFTMLDNLKLGYGGTAEEMARLINDSGVLGSAIKVTAETVKDLPLDVIIAAIHKIQTEMGITGTTANEAADTIAGSFAMFKASWSNLLVGLANNEDIDPLFDAFFEAGETLWKNIKKVAPKIGENLSKAFQRAGEKVKNLWINSVWPSIQKFFKTKLGIELPSWVELEAKVSTWWQGFKEDLQSFCSWTLKLFNAPEEAAAEAEAAISAWWKEKALPGILKASKWALQLFGTPIEDEATVKAHLAAWWKTAGKWVSGACTWVLKLFGMPEENAEAIGNKVFEWWENIKTHVQNACSWVLKLFKAPEATMEEAGKAISDWWTNTALPGILKVSKWALQLFGTPVEDEATVKDHISAWWNTAKKWVHDACTWALGLFGVPEEDAEAIIAKVLGWWQIAKTSVENACSWVLQLFKSPKETMEQAGAAISTWWTNTALPGIQKACIWVLQLFGMPKEDAETIGTKVLEWWNGVKERVQSVCSWILQLFKEPQATAEQAGEAISNWWKNTALPGILNISAWALNLFGHPVENEATVKEHVAAWWNTAVGWVKSASAWALSLFGHPVEDEATVKEHIAAWWKTAVGWVRSASTWALSLFGHPVENEESVVSHIKAWWDVAGTWVSGACSWVLQLFGVPVETADTINKHVKSWFDKFKDGIAASCEWIMNLPELPLVSKMLDKIKTWWKGVTESTSLTLEIDESESFQMLQLVAGTLALASGHPLVATALFSNALMSAYEKEQQAMAENREALPEASGGLWEEFEPYLQGSVGETSEAWEAWMKFSQTDDPYHLAEFLANKTGDQSYLDSYTPSPGDGTGQTSPTDWNSGANSGFMNGWTPNGTTTEMAALITQLQATLNPENFKTAAKEGSAAGIAEGMSGVTITTGSVRLDSGVLVGSILPKINVGLGGMVARGTRG